MNSHIDFSNRESHKILFLFFSWHQTKPNGIRAALLVGYLGTHCHFVSAVRSKKHTAKPTVSHRTTSCCGRKSNFRSRFCHRIFHKPDWKSGFWCVNILRRTALYVLKRKSPFSNSMPQLLLSKWSSGACRLLSIQHAHSSLFDLCRYSLYHINCINDNFWDVL